MSGIYETNLYDRIFDESLTDTNNPNQDDSKLIFNEYEVRRKCLNPQDIDQLAAQFKSISFNLDTWQEMSQLAQSTDPQKRYEGTRKLRLMLSASGEIPIQTVLDTGVLPSLVNYLSEDEYPDLQFEAAWSLTNIASGTRSQTEYVVQQNTIPAFIKLLNSPLEKLREQCMWGLGNIAGDRAQFRDMILNEPDSVFLIIQAIESMPQLNSQQIGIWAISNLCRGYPRPEIHLVLPTIELLLKNLRNHNDTTILTDTCWALDGVVENPIGMKIFLSDPESISLVVPLLENPSTSVQRPALSIVAQIAASSSSPTSNLIASGAIKGLLKLLMSNRRSVRKESCWALSNICLGSISQLPFLIECGVFSALINVFVSDEEMEVKKEAAWAICTTYIAGNMKHVYPLINLDHFKIFSDMLQINDTKVLTLVLDTLVRILKIGELQKVHLGASQSINPYLQLFLQTDGPYQVLQLTQYPDFNVSSKVTKFISEYLSHIPEVDTWSFT